MRRVIIPVIAGIEAVIIIIGLLYIQTIRPSGARPPEEELSALMQELEETEAVAEAGRAGVVTAPAEGASATGDVAAELPAAEREEELSEARPLPGSDITMIGDSITRMSKTQLEEAIPGIEVHGFAGRTTDRTISYNICGLDMAGLLELEGRLRGTVIFAMGTNNVPALEMNTLTDEMFETLYEYTGDRTVYLVTNYDLYDPSIYDENNRVMKKAAETYPDWHIIDWAAAVAANDPQKIILDEGEAATGNQQVHPTDPEGIDLWVSTIKEAVVKE